MRHPPSQRRPPQNQETGNSPAPDQRQEGVATNTEQITSTYQSLFGFLPPPEFFHPIEKVDLKLVGTLNEPDSALKISGVAFSPTEGKLMVSTAQEVDDVPGTSRGVEFVGNGSLRLWNVTTSQMIRSLQNSGANRPQDQFTQVAYSPNGKLVATVTEGMRNQSGDQKSVLQLWDAGTGTLLNTLGASELFIPENVAFSPDSSLIAAGSCEGKGKNYAGVYVCLCGQRRILLHPGVIASIAFSKDGSLLAVGDRSWNPSVRVWDTRTWTRVQDLRAPFPSYGEAVAFSPDGKTLATGHYRGGVYLWDVRTWTRLWTMRSANTEGGGSRSIVFGPEGRFFTFATGERLQFWNPTNGKLLGDFDVNPTSLALHPGGQLLATVSGDKKSIQLWQIQVTNAQ